jgi:hypothetical protein
MKLLLAHIVCLLSLLSWAQKPFVYLEVEPKEAEIGEAITITVKANIQGDVDIDLPAAYVSGYNTMSGMEQEIDYNTGKVITYFYHSQSGTLSKAGNFTIGPAYIKKGNKVYKSNTASVQIKKEYTPPVANHEFTSKQLRQPAFGIIETSKQSIYEGESLLLNAKVYSLFSPTHLENYQEYTLEDVLDKHDIGASNQRIMVDEENIRRTTYFTFEYDKKVVFPIGKGKITIEPFKLLLLRGFESLPLTSSSAVIEIKALPGNAPKDFTGGVGNLKLKRSLSNNDFKQGDVFTLSLEISGNGNLQNLLEPKLNLPQGFLIYGDPEIKEDFVFGALGAEGKVTYDYHIQVTQHGKLELPATTLSYFHPQSEKYIQLTSEQDELIVGKNSNFQLAQTKGGSTINNAVSSDQPAPLRAANNDEENHDFIIGSGIFWFGLSAPILIALLGGIWMRKKPEIAHKKSKNQQKETFKKETELLFEIAKSKLENQEFGDFYSMLEKAFLQSIAIKMNVPLEATINRQLIMKTLYEKNLSESKKIEIKQWFEKCDAGRFGLGSVENNHLDLIASSKLICQNIDK